MGGDLRTHYEVLGSHRGASHAELRECYRRRALEFHPDKQHGNAMAADVREEAFARVQRAWDVLRDADARAAYDAQEAAVRVNAANRRGVVNNDVLLSELMPSDDGDVLRAPCRCGGWCAVREEDTLDWDASSTHIVQCGSCSLSVRVLVDDEDEETAGG